MNCPICGGECVLYEAVHEYHCQNCGWDESSGVACEDLDIDIESEDSSDV
jgi:transcription initiation factor TFIIIB Brf1 subunit/transcription initiation factor TFIIB